MSKGKQLDFSIAIQFYQSYNELNHEAFSDLCKRSQDAVLKAYAPYSNYHVGASILLSNKVVISGNNQENAVYPLGLCAERVTLFSAMSQYNEETIKAIAVATSKELKEGELPSFPCGSCRQALLERELLQKDPIKVFVVGSNDSVCQINSVRDLLPFNFSQSSL